MTWHLRIALSRTFVQPVPGVAACAIIDGGPPDLLGWLESQLGLHVLTNSCARIAALVAAMDRAITAASPQPPITTSFTSHPVAVAARLLEHRDSFLIEVPLTTDGRTPPSLDIDAGDLPSLSPDIPPVLSEFALAAAAATCDERATIMSGEADRLSAVMQALAAGQKLPDHHLIIEDDRDAWPARWRSLLDEIRRCNPTSVLEWEPAPLVAKAPSGCSLHALQSALLSDHIAAALPAVVADDTVRAVRSASAAVAAHITACVLKELPPENLAHTVVVCADDLTAAMIDGLLHSYGCPTMGIATSSQTSEILAVLPLAIEAIGIPADPRRVKEFLALEASPFPRSLRRLLLKAIDDIPAVGSPPWNRVLRRVAKNWKKGGRLARLVEDWIPRPRKWRRTRQVFEVAAVQDAVHRVAKWANRRRRQIERKMQAELAAGPLSPAEQSARALREISKAHYQCLRSRCKAMLVLLQASQASAEYDHVDLMQLIDTATAGSTPFAIHPETVGAPRRVRGFADVGEVLGHVANAVWVGPMRPPLPASIWPHRDVAAMSAPHGISLDSSPRSLTALTRAETAGLCHVAGHLLVVCHPALAPNSRPHPLWALIAEMLWAGTPRPKTYSYAPPLIDPSCATPAISPWIVNRQPLAVEHDPVGIQSITLPAGVALQNRPTVSHTDVRTRLSCPVAWTMHYGASIKKPVDAAPPNEAITKGTVGERVLNEVFTPTPPSCLKDAQARLQAIWRRRLPRLDGAICLSEAIPQRAAFYRVLREALPVLQTLIDAGVTLSFSQPVNRLSAVGGGPLQWQGQTPAGAIDVIGAATLAHGQVPIVIDMKYGSIKKHEDALKSGCCSQLVLYSLFVGRRTPGTAVDAIGYLIISEGCLIVPEWASGVLGDPKFASIVRVVKTKAVLTLPQAIVALDTQVTAASRRMHAAGATLEAHPRAAVGAGTVHPDLALVHGSDAKAAEEAACEYCPYGLLCGRETVV